MEQETSEPTVNPQFKLKGSFGFKDTIKLGYKNGPHGEERLYNTRNGQFSSFSKEADGLLNGLGKNAGALVGEVALDYTYRGSAREWHPTSWLVLETDGGSASFRPVVWNASSGEFSYLSLKASGKVSANIPLYEGELNNSWLIGSYQINAVTLEARVKGEASTRGVSGEVALMALGPNVVYDGAINVGGLALWPGYKLTQAKGKSRFWPLGIEGSMAYGRSDDGGYYKLGASGTPVPFPGFKIETVYLVWEEWQEPSLADMHTAAVRNIDSQLADPNLPSWQRFTLEEIRDEQALLAYQRGVPAADLQPPTLPGGGSGDGPPPPPGGSGPGQSSDHRQFRYSSWLDSWQPGDRNEDWVLQQLEEQGVFDQYLPQFLNPQQPAGFELPGYLQGGQFNAQFAQQAVANGVRQFTPADYLPVKPDQACLIKPYQGDSAPAVTGTITAINGQPAVASYYTDQKSGTTIGAGANANGDFMVSGHKQFTTSNGIGIGIGISFTFDNNKVPASHQAKANTLVAEENQSVNQQYNAICSDFTRHLIDGDYDAAEADLEKGEKLNGQKLLGGSTTYFDGFEGVTVNYSLSFAEQEQLLDELRNEPQEPAFHYSRLTKSAPQDSNDYATRVKLQRSYSIVSPIMAGVDDAVKKGYLPLAAQQYALLDPQGSPALNFAMQTQGMMLLAQPIMQLWSMMGPELLPEDWLMLKKGGRFLFGGAQIFVPTLPALLCQRAMLSSEAFWAHAGDAYINPFSSTWALAGIVTLQAATMILSELPDDWALCKNYALPASYYGLQGGIGINAVVQLLNNGLDIAYMPSYVGMLAAIGFNAACAGWDWYYKGDLSTDPLTYQRRVTINVGIAGGGSVATAVWAGFTMIAFPIALIAAGACYAAHSCEGPIKQGAIKALNVAFSNINVPRKKGDADKVDKNMQAIKKILDANFSGLTYNKADEEIVNAARGNYAGHELNLALNAIEGEFQREFLTPFANLLASDAQAFDLYPDYLFAQVQGLYSKLKKYFPESLVLVCRRLLVAEQYRVVFDRLKQELFCKQIISFSSHSFKKEGGGCFDRHQLPPLFSVELIFRRLWALATSYIAINDFKVEYERLAAALNDEAKGNNAWYKKNWSNILPEFKKVASAFINYSLVFSATVKDPGKRKQQLSGLMIYYKFVGNWSDLMTDRQLLSLAEQFYQVGDHASSQKAARHIRRWADIIGDQKKEIEAEDKEASEPGRGEPSAWLKRKFSGLYNSLKYLGHDGRVKALLTLKPSKDVLISFCDELLNQKEYVKLLTFIEKLDRKNVDFDGISIYRLRADYYQSEECDVSAFLSGLFKRQPTESSTDDFKFIFWRSLLDIVIEFISASRYALHSPSLSHSLLVLHGLVTVCTDKLNELTVNDELLRGVFQEVSADAKRFIKAHRGVPFEHTRKQAHDLFNEAPGDQRARKLESLLRPIALTFFDDSGAENVHMPVDVPADGDCAFHCLGVTREYGVKRLKSVINRLRPQCSDGNIDETSLEEAWQVYSILIDDLQFVDGKVYVKQTAHDKDIADGKDITDDEDIADGKAHMQRFGRGVSLKEFRQVHRASLKEDLRRIDEYLDGFASKPGSDFSYLPFNQGGASVFDALAYVCEKNLHLYQIDTGGKLIRANSITSHNRDFEDCHVLFSYANGHHQQSLGGNHYLRLRKVSFKVEELQADQATVPEEAAGVEAVGAGDVRQSSASAENLPARVHSSEPQFDGGGCGTMPVAPIEKSVCGAVSRPNFYGLKFQRIPGDGHCLFHAVGIYLGREAAWLRRAVADQMENNFDDFKSFHQGDDQSFRTHIEAIRDGSEWGDSLEIEVMQRLTCRPIIIIRPNENPTIPDNLNLFSGDPIFIYYNGRDHYDVFLLEEGANGRVILDRIQADVDQRRSVTYQPAERGEKSMPLLSLALNPSAHFGANAAGQQAGNILRHRKPFQAAKVA